MLLTALQVQDSGSREQQLRHMTGALYNHGSL
jgi:hypothetical protein